MLNVSSELRSCCSLQATFGPPEQRKTRRLNGLQLPLHPQQVAGWFVLIGLTTSTGLLVIPQLAPGLREPITCLLALVLLIHVLAHITALLLDPADPKVRRQPTNLVVPEFDRTKHLHVIENGRCHLCNITTSCKRTKHCSVCNKCVRNFDHHCMWLNNCIGGRNYAAFIVCVVSAITAALTVVGLTSAEVTATFEYWNKNSTMDNITLPFLPIQGTSSLVIISVVGILSAIAAALLIHLCFFHGYIACLGLTTYEYVRNKREKNASNNALQHQNQQINNEAANAFCTEMNQYHFCKTVSAKEGNQPDSNQVFICSTHTQSSNNEISKEKRNFHLYFSYKTHNDATSIELSSRSTLDDQVLRRPSIEQPIELKPSTPSPVSCCFSIMNHHNWSEKRSKQKKSRETEEKPMTRCTTVRRIQSFLRTRLRKNPRARALETSRSRKNRVTPVTSPDSDKELQVQTIAVPVSPKDPDAVVQRPVKLPPLNLPSRRSQTLNGSIDGLDSLAASSEVIFALPVVKRTQHRIRRPSLHRRPRFKMSPHITQSAQLSPIPESELSKPASPRSPQLNHFSFPPTSTD
ncbi:uncharacterized protein LOC103572093 [Microplitis demolitor]|uniref:uncharacterized protein LOC103572093 n=1 Tax=Microplitis demolitor TaxID=69319 RepID=UPI0004CCEAC3|nr:uncharacterized protein LOC103572093 [Microplitis demolitor]